MEKKTLPIAFIAHMMPHITPITVIQIITARLKVTNIFC